MNKFTRKLSDIVANITFYTLTISLGMLGVGVLIWSIQWFCKLLGVM